MLIVIPQRGHGHRHSDSLRLPIVAAVPGTRHPVVVQGALRQGRDVLIGQRAVGGVCVDALLLVHYPIDWVLATRLSNR